MFGSCVAPRKLSRYYGGVLVRCIGAMSLRLPQLAPRRVELAIAWPGCEVQTDIKLPERNPIASPRQLTTHPLIWSEKLIVADGERILALHPDTGLIADAYALPGRPDVPDPIGVLHDRPVTRKLAHAGHSVGLFGIAHIPAKEATDIRNP